MSQCRLGEVLVFEILKERTRESFFFGFVMGLSKNQEEKIWMFCVHT